MGSIRGMEDYPRNLMEFDTRFDTEDACREYPFNCVGRMVFVVPACDIRKSWPVRGVLLECAGCGYQMLGHGRHDLSGHAHPFTVMVSGNVVDHDPEERGQRFRFAARAGPEAVPDRVDMAAQVAQRDGQSGPRFADW